MAQQEDSTAFIIAVVRSRIQNQVAKTLCLFFKVGFGTDGVSWKSCRLYARGICHHPNIAGDRPHEIVSLTCTVLATGPNLIRKSPTVVTKTGVASCNRSRANSKGPGRTSEQRRSTTGAGAGASRFRQSRPPTTKMRFHLRPK